MFDAFKKRKTERIEQSEVDSDEEAQTELNYVSNLLHSIFSNWRYLF